MPELPEVETVAKALQRALTGRSVASVAFLGKTRLPFDAGAAARALKGKTFTGVRRRAKYLILDFDCERVLLAHLGMTGYFHIDPSDEERHLHDRIVFGLDGGDELRYADARRFGFVALARRDGDDGLPAELSHLGPEPLERRFCAKAMLERATGRKAPVKVFIMDQEVVVGVGNIYASEALFAAGVDPRRPAGSLSLAEWTRLVAEVKAVLRRALRSGGSTIRNYRTVDGSEGGFQRVLKVYGKTRENCPACGSEVRVIRLGGRSTFFCPECQR